MVGFLRESKCIIWHQNVTKTVSFVVFLKIQFRVFYCSLHYPLPPNTVHGVILRACKCIKSETRGLAIFRSKNPPAQSHVVLARTRPCGCVYSAVHTLEYRAFKLVFSCITAVFPDTYSYTFDTMVLNLVPLYRMYSYRYQEIQL